MIQPLEKVVNFITHKDPRPSIITTCGCFDLFHRGHLFLLSQLVRTGKMVVVLVNTDDSVRALKGPGRPTVPFEHRAGLVDDVMRFIGRGNQCCFVVPLHNDTPSVALSFIRPEIHVKGEEWAGKEIPEAKYCGRVEFIDSPYDIHSSDFIDRVDDVHAQALDDAHGPHGQG